MRWRPDIASWTALIFVAIAVAAVALYDHHKLRAWMPNIATSAASVAITVTIINGIVRREAHRRLRPRVAAALQSLSGWVQSFSGFVVLDYGSLHVGASKRIPKSASEMFDLWVSEWWNINAWAGEHIDSIIGEGQRLADAFEQIRARNFDVLEPDLVRALDEFHLHMAQINYLLQSSIKDPYETDETRKHVASRRVVEGVHRFSLVLERYAPVIPIDKTFDTIIEMRQRPRRPD